MPSAESRSGTGDPAPTAVLGAGSWGTALAWLLGDQGRPVRLWGRNAQLVEQLRRDRENRRYLPGVILPAPVEPVADLQAAVGGAPVVILAVPAGAVRSLLAELGPTLEDQCLTIAAKGLELRTGLRLTEVAAEELGAGALDRTAILSGPNLSGEIVRRLPTATVIGTGQPGVAARLQAVLGAPFFRVYSNSDVIGVELGGALKNPVALAAGMSDGLGFGNNAKASLLTRGLAEMRRIGVAAGARKGTFSGLSGLGDLIATAHSPLSRNYRVGFALGSGESLEAVLAGLGHVAEGVPTVAAACALAERLNVEVPIFRALRQVLYEGQPLARAVEGLLTRPYRDEDA
jgi:glycerol-3-phosphate dehydrogenase (NAD(P)+)